MTTPAIRAAADAFRLWQYAESVAWDCTIAAAAEAIGIRTRRAAKLARAKGWTEDFRAADTSTTYAPWLHSEQMETARHVRRTIAGDW